MKTLFWVVVFLVVWQIKDRFVAEIYVEQARALPSIVSALALPENDREARELKHALLLFFADNYTGMPIQERAYFYRLAERVKDVRN